MLVRLLRTIVLLFVALFVVLPLGAALLALELSPDVAAGPPPDAEAALRTRQLAKSVKDAVEGDQSRGTVAVSEPGLNAALASASRMLPGLRGEAEVSAEEARIAVSLPVPGLAGRLWLNMAAGLAASERGLAVTEARIGRISVPPDLVLPAAALVMNRILGDGLGDAAIAGVERVRLAPPEVEVDFAFSRADHAALKERARGLLRGRAGGVDPERVHVYLDRMHRAAERGALPETGSVLPYLRLTLDLAAERAQPSDAEDEMRAALVALALYCGEERMGPLIGVGLQDGMRGKRNLCARTVLAGRDDLKRHFFVSAGLFVISTDMAALGVGEMKELLDSNPGGSGFSFDDMTANLAGARLAERFYAAPPSAWPGLAAGIDAEQDLLPSTEGLDAGLSVEEFAASYGNIDDPAYAAVIDEIGRRIDALPLHSDTSIY